MNGLSPYRISKLIEENKEETVQFIYSTLSLSQVWKELTKLARVPVINSPKIIAKYFGETTDPDETHKRNDMENELTEHICSEIVQLANIIQDVITNQTITTWENANKRRNITTIYK